MKAAPSSGDTQTSDSDPAALPAAPPSVVGKDGRALFGRYQGAPHHVSYERLEAARTLGPVGRLVREKRWRFLMAADDRLLLGALVADFGYLGLGFAWVVDRHRQRVLANEGGLTLPLLSRVGDETWHGTSSRWRGLAGSIEMSSPDEKEVRLDLDLGEGLRGGLSFEPVGMPPLTVVAPVERGTVNTTVKRSGLRARGGVSVAGERFEIDGLGAFDYTHGLLARETSWRWAFGVGRDGKGRSIGFNLVTGFNGGAENALWVEGRLVALDPAGATIAFEGDPATSPWTVRTAGGEIELRFLPTGARSEALNIWLLGSTYVQPIGRFEGRIAGEEVGDLAGVVEDHYTKW